MRRFIPDVFTQLLVLTVALATLYPARGAIAAQLGVVADLAIAFLFFLHGARLSREVVLAGLLHWRLHLVILLSTFGLFPLLGLMLDALDVLSSALQTGVLFLCVLPSTVQSSIAFTSIARGNVPAAVCAASVSNVFGLFLTPLWIGLVFAADGDEQAGVSLDAVELIVAQLLAPFVLGQILQPWIGEPIRRARRWLSMTDRGSILLVVFLAFSKAVTEALWRNTSPRELASLVAVDIALLVAVLVITTLGSRLLGFAREDEIAIVFCGSKKSLASGVPMANVIFAGHAISAVVLPLMLFHQIQLMVCAVLAQRYAERTTNATLRGASKTH